MGRSPMTGLMIGGAVLVLIGLLTLRAPARLILARAAQRAQRAQSAPTSSELLQYRLLLLGWQVTEHFELIGCGCHALSKRFVA